MKTAALPLLLALLLRPALAAPDLILAENWQGQDVRGWAMSEKLDGVRAYWDGQQLLSRAGYPFRPPAGFLADYPPWPLDGELYRGRSQFEATSAAVRAVDGDWRGINLHVFDVPQATGDLYQRLATLETWLREHPQARIRLIAQTPVKNREHITSTLKTIEQQGGEGLMLREPNQPYHGGRSPYLLKVKSAPDAECTVVAHHPGKGKHTGRLGAITCENEHGRFRIGSGFTDAERAHPPAIGSTITDRYRGFTRKGTPRFATYLRPRNDIPPAP